MTASDTVRDAPGAEPQPRGKVLPWVLLILGALTALTAGLGALGSLVPVDRAQALRMAGARGGGLPPHAVDKLMALTNAWRPWTLAATIPYALAAAAMAAMALGVVLEDRPSRRQALMIAAVVAAVARVGLGLVNYQVAADAVDAMGEMLRDRPGPSQVNDRDVARAQAMVGNIAGYATNATTVVVTLFWLIAGIAAGPRKDDEAPPPEPAG